MSIRVFPVVSQVAKRVLHPQVIPWINFTLSESVIALRRFLKSLHTKLKPEGKIITVRKRNCGKVMFLHQSVILFTGRCVYQHALGQTSPLADTPLTSACWDTHTPAQCMLGYTPLPRRPLLRTVRIPLECILVFDNFCFHTL